MSNYFLPKLSKNTDIPQSAGNGWQTFNLKLIDDLRKDLDLGSYKPENFNIDSIPDVWARPILFDMALYDPGHTLHQNVVEEWEGMLALLALKEIRHISQLSVKPVHIPEGRKSRDTNGTDAETSDFMKVLGKMLPERSISGNTSWSDLYVILFDNQAIGMTSPLTLVCTAIDMPRNLPGIPWFDGYHLKSPAARLNKRDRNALVFWLKSLKSRLVSDNKIDMGMLDKLLNLIGDSNSGYIGKLNTDESTGICRMSSGSLGMTEGIFRYMNTPVANVNHDDIGTSNILLLPSEGKKPVKRLLITDQDMWGMNKADITAFGTVTLEGDFSGYGKDRTALGSEKLPPNTEWRCPEDFFTEKLFYMELTDVFPGALKLPGRSPVFPRSEITVIMPLRAELLDQLDPEDLNSRVGYEVEGDNITVSLELTLSGFEDGRRNIILKKTYQNRRDEIKMLSVNVPIVELWPNFVKASEEDPWQVYYSYFRRSGVNSFYCEPYPAEGELNNKVTESDNFGIKKEVVRLKKPPEAMLCHAQLGNPKTNSIQTLEAGLILLKKPEKVLSMGKIYNIGVDFGTTGTVVYAKVGNDSEPSNIKFDSRLMHITDSRAASDIYLYDEFLPYFVTEEEEDGKVQPFLSIFHRFPNTGISHKLRPLMDGHIFFFDSYDRFEASKDGIETNLKWGDMQQRTYAGTFMQQLCMQCAAEAVADGASHINWRFSFPTAFSRFEAQDYEQKWSQISEETGRKCGVHSSSEESGLVKMSESIAAARYFLSKPDANASLSRGFVCIDIGGGTTDLSIWQGQSNYHLLQASLRFAGRDIFLELIRRKPQFLQIFGIAQEQLSKLVELKNEKPAFYAQAEALIAEKSSQLLLALSSANAHPEVKSFINIIAVAFAGIYFYIGLLLRYLIEQGKFNRRLLPNIYIGGNGSNILHWLASGSYNKKSYVNDLFKHVLTDAVSMGMKEDFDIFISPAPKTEAACGLICDADHILRDSGFISNTLIAGEDFLRQGGSGEEDGKREWSGLIGAADVKAGLEVSPELTQVRRFIESYNRHASDMGLTALSMEERGFVGIEDYINQQLLAQKGQNEDKMRVEPLFISALKKIMELKTNEWSEK